MQNISDTFISYTDEETEGGHISRMSHRSGHCVTDGFCWSCCHFVGLLATWDGHCFHFLLIMVIGVRQRWFVCWLMCGRFSNRHPFAFLEIHLLLTNTAFLWVPWHDVLKESLSEALRRCCGKMYFSQKEFVSVHSVEARTIRRNRFAIYK